MICPNCDKEMIKSHYEKKFINNDILEVHTEYWCTNCDKEIEQIDYYICYYQDTEFAEVD